MDITFLDSLNNDIQTKTDYKNDTDFDPFNTKKNIKIKENNYKNSLIEKIKKKNKVKVVNVCNIDNMLDIKNNNYINTKIIKKKVKKYIYIIMKNVL